MNCDRCGQRVNEVPECEHRFVGQAADDTLRCNYCGHNFGPVRELIEAKETLARWDSRPSPAESLLQEQVATLTRERDEARDRANRLDACMHGWKCNAERAERDVTTARARIAELEKATAPFTASDLVVHANGTWEWRKV